MWGKTKMKLSHLSIILLILGFAVMIIGIITGESKAGIFLIFPYVVTSSPITILGIILIFLGFIILFLVPALTLEDTRIEESYIDRDRKVEYGGVILIGPFPIAFGSSKKLALIMIVIGLIIFIVMTIIITSLFLS